MENRTRKLVTASLLAALYYLLSIFAKIDLAPNFRLSFAGLPVILSGVLLGPTYGMLTGLVGSFLEQLLGKYGLTATTPLWLIPEMGRGLITGLLCRRMRPISGSKADVRLWTILCAGAFFVTCSNTFAIWADARINGYDAPGLGFAVFLLKLLSGALTMLLFTLVLPQLIRAAQRAGLRTKKHPDDVL